MSKKLTKIPVKTTELASQVLAPALGSIHREMDRWFEKVGRSFAPALNLSPGTQENSGSEGLLTVSD
jgi:hypothetical protein